MKKPFFLLLSALALVKIGQARNNDPFSLDFGFHQQTTARKMCPPGQILVDKPEGTICIRDMRYRYVSPNSFDMDLSGMDFAFNSSIHAIANQYVLMI